MLKTVSKVVLTVLAGFVIGSTILSCTTKSLTQEGVKSAVTTGKFRGIVKLKTVDNMFFCSAVVISNTQAVSAAHCFMHLPANEFIVESIANENKKVLVAGANVVAYNGRADTALIGGDFSEFDQFQIDTNPESDILVNDYNLVTCGFPYGGNLVCYKFSGPYKMVDGIAGAGQMYAGMSGGPVIDLKSGKVLAVNHAVSQGFVVIAPLVSFFQSLRRVQ